MAEALDQTDDDEKRWAQAESILRDAPTPDAEQAIRRRRRATWILVAALTALGLAFGLVVALLVHRHQVPPHEPPVAQEITGLVVQGLGVIVELSGLTLQIRSGNWGARWRAPTSALNRRQKRWLLKQVRGRVPVDPSRLPLARDLAARAGRQQGLVVMVVGLMVANVGQTIARPTVWRLSFSGAFFVLFAVSVVLQWRLARQARRFLEANPG